ncbi:hypothetical protein [Micromonospora sp. NPDC006431]|uniref:hypothetical protein n=1 Tax=Micromonospora sp. NPDC006431 TaxID=3364235 RepID=UPI00369BC872
MLRDAATGLTPPMMWWEVGEVTYSLRLEPAEGGTFTLKQFKQEIASLRWS